MTIARQLGAAILASSLLIASGFGDRATALAKQAPCQKAYSSSYLKRPAHKAAATTGGRSLSSPSTSCGFSWSQPTRRAAAREALRQCALATRRFGYHGSCRVIAAK